MEGTDTAAGMSTGRGSFDPCRHPLPTSLGGCTLALSRGAEGSFHQSFSLDFLPTSFHGTSRDPLPIALKDKTASAVAAD